MNWDQNKAFLAQALGPGVVSSSIQPFHSDDVTLATSSGDAYAASWVGTWKVLSSSGGESGAPPSEASDNHLSAGPLLAFVLLL